MELDHTNARQFLVDDKLFESTKSQWRGMAEGHKLNVSNEYSLRIITNKWSHADGNENVCIEKNSDLKYMGGMCPSSTLS